MLHPGWERFERQPPKNEVEMLIAAARKGGLLPKESAGAVWYCNFELMLVVSQNAHTGFWHYGLFARDPHGGVRAPCNSAEFAMLLAQELVGWHEGVTTREAFCRAQLMRFGKDWREKTGDYKRHPTESP